MVEQLLGDAEVSSLSAGKPSVAGPFKALVNP
jgi:hypothetical protein